MKRSTIIVIFRDEDQEERVYEDATIELQGTWLVIDDRHRAVWIPGHEVQRVIVDS